MENWIYVLFLIIVLCLLLLLFKEHQIKRYYTKQGVPLVQSMPIFGMFGEGFFKRKHINDLANDIYNMNKDCKYMVDVTLFYPQVIVRDLDLTKSVLVKNFDHFADHQTFTTEANDPLFSKNIAVLNGDKWRTVRNLLSPAFTASKMRIMFVLISRCSENFSEQFIKNYVNEDCVDFKNVFSRFTIDVIATCAFGIEVDSIKNPNNEFYLTGKKCSFNSGWKILKFFFITLFPKFSSMIGMRLIPKEETDFFVNLIDTTIKTRAEKGITRPDMLQLLIDAQNKENDNNKLDSLEITAQAFIFFLAGFDTTSDAMIMMAYELAVNPDIQEKLQDEIDTVMRDHNDKPTYEAINNMPYLDAIFNETMRMHSLGIVSRVCSKDFELPPSLPNSQPFLIKSGTEVVITASGFHRDPQFYKNPDKFDPDRYFNKEISNDAINLGFGLGPRMCLGNRFANLVIKILFVHLLAKCKLEPCKKTCIPLKYNPGSISATPKGGAWLKIQPRK